ncbi:MAG TPA: hypothetical protein VL201_04380, partial [Patescibacteria group bacterium]|nr:hypothetical protein [Patescibacteria group bacterium]
MSFFIDFFGCSVSHLSKDTWHIIFNFVFNDTKYQQLNARRFFSYLRSDSDECYRIAFPAVAQTNKILYCAFQESLSGHTRTYLKHNILTMLAEKYNPYNKLLLPATKFLYLFSDIQSEKKDTEIQLSVNEIEDVYITKQEKYKVFKENYNSVIVPYQKIHSTMTGKALNQLIDEKNTAQIFVRKLELKKEAQEHELRTLSDEKYPEARSALGNLISQQTNELKKEIEAFKYSSLIVEMYQRLQALSAVILKQPINDIAHLNLVVLIKKVNEKNEKKKLKLRNQMTVLLKLKIIQIFSSFINSDKHRDVVTSANKYESSIKAATEKLVGIDLNKEYFEYFFRQYDDEIENIESLFWSTLKCITAKKEGLIIPYLPAKNNELVI